ncbi:MAG: GAF domain-containing protein, partial [Chloroflexota bacterium]
THLHSQAEENPVVTLIFLDASEDQNPMTTCQQLCQDEAMAALPLIAIIAQPAKRAAVLEAGADDYLLLPLLPAEVNTRLATYLHSSCRGFNSLIEVIQQMNSGASPGHILSPGIKSLAEIFNAPSAWLLLIDPDRAGVSLVSGYNLPPLFQSREKFDEEAVLCTRQIENSGSTLPQVIACPFLAKGDHQETDGLLYHLSVPLYGKQRFLGYLNLAYRERPKTSRAERRVLGLLGQNIGILLEMMRWQEEIQVHATQVAFMVLLARSISERLETDTILSFTLEQAVSLLNASGGQIWLLSAERDLELVSSLRSPFPIPADRASLHPGRIKRGQGLIGWVAAHSQPLSTHVAANDPRFDPQVDRFEDSTDISLLAVPLRHRHNTIGVLAIYNKHHTPFANQDVVLLEGVAALSASAMANARLMQELRDYTDRQRELMKERERLQKQILQAERLATVGRLTASLSHEINNPMQSIRGALTLALEELNNPAELATYLHLSLEESERVVRLLNRMRQIYRPKTGIFEPFDLNGLLQEAIGLANKELKRQKVSIRTDLAPDLPSPTVVVDQLHLVLLSLLLNLGSAISAAGGGELHVRSYTLPQTLLVEFSTDISVAPLARRLFIMEEDRSERTTDLSFGLFLSQEIIAAHGGVIKFDQQDQQFVCRIELPTNGRQKNVRSK